MVRRLLPAAHVLVDAGVDEPVSRLWREQDVVDADAIVLLPGAGLIVPECEEARLIAAGPDCVSQPEIAQGPKPFPRLRQEQRVTSPQLRASGISRGRNDVEVAGEDERLLQRQPFVRIANKSI